MPGTLPDGYDPEPDPLFYRFKLRSTLERKGSVILDILEGAIASSSSASRCSSFDAEDAAPAPC